jgi:carbamoyltransferase
MLGPEFSTEEIQHQLDSCLAVYRTLDGDQELADEVANLLAAEKVVGWFQGKMEFGPRALGGRSILGDPRSSTMQSLMNLKIKFRESFRPFAPVVLREHVDQYFEMRPGEDSPYMLLVAPVQPSQRHEVDTASQEAFGIDKLGFRRSKIPAVTHVDYSARVQTIDRQRRPLMHQLLSSFHNLTDCPVLINTSFNVRGEPIVCTPLDAWQCFLNTDMDVLAIGRCLLLKEEQTERRDESGRREHLSQFQLD